MKERYKLAFMDMACRFGETSYAERLKVGCLIVKNDSVISLGVNGMPPKWPTEVCEDKSYAHDIDNHWYLFGGSQEVTEETLTKLYATQYPHVDETGRYKLITKPECRHGEIAALEKLWNSTETARGAEMFISHSPCKNCCIKILTAGINKVYYRYEYRDTEGLNYLKENGVEVEQIDNQTAD